MPSNDNPLLKGTLTPAGNTISGKISTLLAVEAAAERAEKAADEAENSANLADASANTASSAALAAEGYATNAANAKNAAEGYATNAANAKNASEGYAVNAENAKNAAEGYATNAENAKNAAEGYATNAENAKNAAEESERNIDAKVEEAQGYAQEAVNARNASNEAKNAAVTAKNDAETAKTGAETAQGKAEEAQGKAETAQDNAEAFAESAQASADRAEQEADRWYEFLPVDTASGSLAHFTDGAKDVPVKSLSVALEPVQDLHGQSSPYPAGGGKNLFDVDARIVGTTTAGGAPYPNAYTKSGDAVTISKNLSENGRVMFSAQTLTAGTYTLSFAVSLSGTGRVTYSVRNMGADPKADVVANTYVQAGSITKTFTIAEDASIAISILPETSNGGTATITGIQLETGSTATPYAPYSNICPITGHTQVAVNRTGKNLMPLGLTPSAVSGVSVEDVDGGYKLISRSSTSGYLWARFLILDANAFTGQTLTLHGKVALSNPTDPELAILYRDESDALITRAGATAVNGVATVSYTVPDDAKGNISISLYLTGATIPQVGWTATWTELQLELSSTASSYEPYSGQSITIPLGDTVYGGTLDVTNGVLTVDRAMATYDGSESWALDSPANRGFYIQRWALVKTLNYVSAITCDRLPTYASHDYIDYVSAEYGITGYYDRRTQYTTNWIYAKANGASTDADFKAWLADNNLQVVYELATPVKIHLTPQQMTTLLGINNVWSDSGDVSVDYRADVQLYIQKMIANAINN